MSVESATMATVDPVAIIGVAVDAGADAGCEPRRPGRPRSADVDQAVLAATIELAGEVGVTKMSMDDVAERAKVSKATIYRRWTSKEALVLDALQSAISVLDETDTGTLRGDLTAYLGQLVERVRNGRLRDVLPHLIEVACHDEALRSSLDQYVDSRRVPMLRILDRAAERGQLPAGIDVEVLVDALIAPFFYRRLLRNKVVDANFVDQLLALVLPDSG
jgi:AcrR family transcriptional regulator